MEAQLSEGATRTLIASAWVCAGIALTLWIGPTLLRPDVFNGDATQHIYWLYRYADPGLFANDLAARYFSSDSVAPLGYRALYYVLASFADAQWISEVVAGVLLSLSLALAWRLGSAVGTQCRAVAALLAVVVTAALLPFNDLLPPSGFQRTFALPITLLCLYALVSGRYIWVGVSWLLAALVYPIMIPVLGMTAAIVFLGDLIRARRLPPMWHLNALLGLAAVAIVVYGSGTPPDIGPMVTYEQAMTMPEFGPQGRQSLYGAGTWRELFWHHRTGLGWSPWMLMVMGVAAAIVVVAQKRYLIPRPVWIMAASGVGLWLAARLVMFHLYLPNRHSRMALAAFAIVVIAVALYVIWHMLARRYEERLAWGLACLAPLVVAAALWPRASELWQRPVNWELERAYAFISSLPKDTLIAAHPNLADFVPLRTRRSVLASTEESIAFMLGYHRQLTPRLEASLRAAYATTWSELENALAPFGVEVVLTAPQVWQERRYYPPFDTLTHELWAKGERHGFVLRHPPASRILFRSGETYVLSVKRQP